MQNGDDGSLYTKKGLTMSERCKHYIAHRNSYKFNLPESKTSSNQKAE